MTGFSVYDQTFLDSDHPLLDFMDGMMLSLEINSGTHPPNLWSEPDSNVWAASNTPTHHDDSLYILENSDRMAAVDTHLLKHEQPTSMESFLGSQNKPMIRDENSFSFNNSPFVLEHSQCVIDKRQGAENFSTSINKIVGSENDESKTLVDHTTSPSHGRVKRKPNQHGRASHHNNATLHNSTKKRPFQELEQHKCKRFRSWKYPQVGSESTKIDDNKKKKSEAELPPKIVNKEAKGEAAFEDYIHVRARRGQATDSHSLAERVRREKIRERMKRLQELVPGCSKVTGKAQMLDEIINYVQSMQSQVEFLSVKLASVLRLCSVNLEIDGILPLREEIVPLPLPLPLYIGSAAE